MAGGEVWRYSYLVPVRKMDQIAWNLKSGKNRFEGIDGGRFGGKKM